MLLVLKHALWQDLKRCGGEKKHTQILGFTCKNNAGKENCVIHATNSGTALETKIPVPAFFWNTKMKMLVSWCTHSRETTSFK